ncbi:hypothetical protein HDV00_011187 [Rhizophlyctis rosea]|nr:hypothetical protein HDV00_011187 [Rhizophlyctis rosea]
MTTSTTSRPTTPTTLSRASRSSQRASSSSTLNQTVSYIRTRKDFSAYKALKAREKKLDDERKQTIKHLRESMGVDDEDVPEVAARLKIFADEEKSSAGKIGANGVGKAGSIQLQAGKKESAFWEEMADVNITIDQASRVTVTFKK